jgi:hypothetical protein
MTRVRELPEERGVRLRPATDDDVAEITEVIDAASGVG